MQSFDDDKREPFSQIQTPFSRGISRAESASGRAFSRSGECKQFWFGRLWVLLCSIRVSVAGWLVHNCSEPCGRLFIIVQICLIVIEIKNNPQGSTQPLAGGRSPPAGHCSRNPPSSPARDGTVAGEGPEECQVGSDVPAWDSTAARNSAASSGVRTGAGYLARTQ